MGICTSKSSVKSNDPDGNNERVVPNSRGNVIPPTANVSDPKPEQEREEAEGSPVAPTPSPDESITPVAQGKGKIMSKLKSGVKDKSIKSKQSDSITMDANKAATIIQAAYRGFHVRKLRSKDGSKKFKSHKKGDANNTGEESSATYSSMADSEASQKSVHVKTTKGSLPHHEKAQRHDKQEEEDNEKGKIIDTYHALDPNTAATKIQAVFKGHQVRKNQHNLHKPSDDLPNAHSQTPSPEEVVEKTPEINVDTSAKSEKLPTIDPNEAATKIQAVFKGHQVRKNFKEHHDLRHLESAETGSNKLIEIRAPTETSNPDNAIIAQGDAPHSPIGDSPVHHEEDHDSKMDEEEAATKIQAYFKGFKTRKELEKEFHHHRVAS